MPALVIKNLPEDIYKELKQTAKKHRRSMTGEAVYLLEQGLAKESASLVSENAIPTPYEGTYPLTQAMITRWKRKGMA